MVPSLQNKGLRAEAKEIKVNKVDYMRWQVQNYFNADRRRTPILPPMQLLSNPVQTLLNDKNKRNQVVRILLQTLNSMGFKESAQELKRESQMQFQEQAEERVRLLFQQRKYAEVEQIIQKLPLPTPIKLEANQLLTQLTVLQMINENDYEGAIELVARSWSKDEEKQLTFLSIIATGQPIEAHQMDSLQRKILEKCITDSVQLKSSIDKMLKGYMGISELNPQTMHGHHPPETVAAESEALTCTGKVSFVRLHPNGQLICLVSENAKEVEVSLWEVRGKKIKKDVTWRAQGFGLINTVDWDYDGDRLAVCSYIKVALLQLSYEMFKPTAVIEAKELSIPKFLCARWCSDGTLYLGGLFEGLAIADKSGKVVRMIQPFMRTRSLVFDGSKELLAIGATRGVLLRYNSEQEQVMATFEAKSSFMDLRLDAQTRTVVATNKEYIYLLQANTLATIAAFSSPDNQKMWKIEAFLYKGWLLVYNQKLTAVLQNKQATRHHSWSDCDAVDVGQGKMVTAKFNIILWESSSKTSSKVTGEKDANREPEINEEREGSVELLSRSYSENASNSIQERVSVSSDLSDNFIDIEYLQNEDEEQEEDQQEL